LAIEIVAKYSIIESIYNVKKRGDMRGENLRSTGQELNYGPSTKVVMLPITKLQEIDSVLKNNIISTIPLFSCSVSAGFPSPADDHMDCKLDLNEHLIKHPSATFFARASGDSMEGAGIYDGDLLIVDRSLDPINGKIVIAVLNGELTVKRYVAQGDEAFLWPENNKYKPIKITQDSEVLIWGVVTNVIHKV
jgi:DNA polymerase V